MSLSLRRKDYLFVSWERRSYLCVRHMGVRRGVCGKRPRSSWETITSGVKFAAATSFSQVLSAPDGNRPRASRSECVGRHSLVLCKIFMFSLHRMRCQQIGRKSSSELVYSAPNTLEIVASGTRQVYSAFTQTLFHRRDASDAARSSILPHNNIPDRRRARRYGNPSDRRPEVVVSTRYPTASSDLSRDLGERLLNSGSSLTGTVVI